MTVKELMEQLSKQDPNGEVYIYQEHYDSLAEVSVISGQVYVDAEDNDVVFSVY